MAETDLQLKAIDALVHIHTVIKNLRPYSSVNSSITNFIEMLYLYLLDILRQDAPLVFAELEKNSQLQAKLLNQQEHETINASSLLDIFLVFSVKSISCDKHLGKEELDIFIKLLAKGPKSAQNEEGLHNLMMENKITHIHPDNKTLEPVAKDQGIVAKQDIAKDGISESIAAMEKVFTRLNTMHGAIESLPSEEKKEEIKRLSIQVAEWIEMETTVTPTYKEICHRLQPLLQEFINYRFFAEADLIIDVFSKINNGALKKDDKVREVSLEVLRKLASDDNINILFKEVHINEKNKTPSFAFQILTGFGDIIIYKLLNILRHDTDSKKRINTIHIIEEMGQMAIPAIRKKITADDPWYFLRNMAYILGRIGHENSADILRPLLLHEDKRVSREAFKSIGQIGGNKKGLLLLSVLSKVDKELRVNIIEMLGKIKCTEAVPNLLDMLKNKSSMAKEDQISMQEKICKALGSIGSPEAIKTLSEIAESKSILGIGSYPKEVKHAAERALEDIRRK